MLVGKEIGLAGSELTDYEQIYDTEAEAYDRMVRAEDCEGAVAHALQELADLRGKRALEVGVGTGRITELLLDGGASVVGFERAPAMLNVARRRLARHERRLELRVGDARDIDVPRAGFAMAVAGWVFGHMTRWEQDWRHEIGRALDGMERAVVAGGHVAIFETLGTGTAKAAPPDDELAAYYGWLERERGYAATVLRTDYAFATPERAAAAIRFFFGDGLADQVLANGWSRIREHTGLWHRVVGRAAGRDTTA